MSLIKNVNELNERITFMKKEPNPGPEPGETEIELFSCWAKIKTQFIKDVKDYEGTAFEDTVEVVIRQIQDYEIDNTMVVKWQGKSYSIIKINPDYAYKEYMVIVVKVTK